MDERIRGTLALGNTSKHSSTVTKAALVIFANLFLLTAVLYGFESLFSPYNRLPFNGEKDGKRYTWGHAVENNRYGFRERDFATPKPSDVYRVMVLGDSLTWGAGLSVDQRYTVIVERLLNEAFPGQRLEVLNFGISGGPTTQERDILERLKREVNPDLIVVGFCLNDPQPKRQDHSVEREQLANSILGQAVDRTSHLLADLGLLYTAKLFNNAFYRTAERLGIIPGSDDALGRAYEPSSSEWRAFAQALTDIKGVSDELHLSAPLFAVLDQGGGRNPRWSQWFQQAEKAAADAGFVAYNHAAEIAARLHNQSLIINEMDGHPSAAVNRIYGEKLFQVIARQFSTQG
jgi:lysophospholipase L1-like esterase